MRCKHCGSSCADPLPDELGTEDALDAIRQFADLGLRWVTLSGGEPLTRKDWPQLVHALSERGIAANMITNGWLITEETARQLVENHIATVAISIDGTREVHDAIRKAGSFERIERSFKILKEHGINCGAVTTISKENIDILPQIKEELIRMGASSWQVQLGLPMGNFAERRDWLLEPERVDEILDFCYRTNLEGRILMYPADCLGYYNHKELRARQLAFNTPEYQLWDGCNAGTRGFGFLHNGDILGCTSIRSREFIEGNIKEHPLRTIWEDPDAFKWRRGMTKDMLGGDCKTCKYGSKCLGGCPNTRLTIEGDIYGENRYCSYNVALKQSSEQIRAYTNTAELFDLARQTAREQEYQKASQLLDRLLELETGHHEALRLKGFTEFMNGNYALSEGVNRRILSVEPQDAYAKKGLGLALFRQGKRDEGLKLVKEAAIMGDEDALSDLQALYHEMGRPKESE
jgi:radical SAM protein with 4Fe4S-binding SPASM domain